MTPNGNDRAAALKGATLAFKNQPGLSIEVRSTEPEVDEDIALIAATREFGAKRRQIEHRQESSDTEDYDSELAVGAKQLKRSPSIDTQAGLVGDRIRQFSLKAADLAVDRQEQRRSISLRRSRNEIDTHYIAAKLAAEREKTVRPASADPAAQLQPIVTRSGVTILPRDRKRDGSVKPARRRPSEAHSLSSASRYDDDSHDGRQPRRIDQNGTPDDSKVIRTPHVRPTHSTNSLITLYDRHRTLASSRERLKPPPNPQIPSANHERPPKLPCRPKPTSQATSPSKDSSTDKEVTTRPALPHREVSKESHKSINDSLQGAVVASNLAEARARDAPPRPPPPRRSGYDRPPSPTKIAFKQTLREEETDDIDELKRLKRYKKHHLINKHPHKHSEGTKKRWRDTITERERKRYAGVWAANQGLWIVFDNHEKRINPSEKILNALPEGVSPETMVLNIVVQDIWSRSRLSQDTLSSIWDLVSHTANGMLSREEFVVGMWLIDQCLKGRKLPIKVSQSVWASSQTFANLNTRPNRR
ncbi:Increased rDNA silencing protein [Ascosphaera aggregata]|nr:Increased rDNA silencing protein [Ascosphaera aggregata]